MDYLKGHFTFGSVEVDVDEVEVDPFHPLCLDCTHSYLKRLDDGGALLLCDYDEEIPCPVVIKCSKFSEDTTEMDDERDDFLDEENIGDFNPINSYLNKERFLGVDAYAPKKEVVDFSKTKEKKKKKPKGFG